MFKRLFFLGLSAAVLASIAALVYNKVYNNAMATDFSKIINPVSIAATCMVACLAASVVYWALMRWLKNNTDIVFGLAFGIGSFASIMGPLTMKLPLDMQSPELFPGLAIPMHFFPLIAWLMLKPLFVKEQYVKVM